MNQELLERILRSPRLPSLPVVALEVIELAQAEDVNLNQIADTIQYDPALATKILKTVNSSFYGQAKPISTIQASLVVLGLNAVKTLALGFSLVGNLRECGGDGFDPFAFWKRSLYGATASRILATRAGSIMPEEAFMGGLLRDLGILATSQVLGAEYSSLIEKSGGDHKQLIKLEREQLRTDHAELGAAIADTWKLPPSLSVPIRFHEFDRDAPLELLPLVRSVRLGDLSANVFVSDDPGDALDRFQRHALEWFKLSPADSDPVLKEIHAATSDMRRLFDLPTGELGNYDEILARANEALLQISLQTQQATNVLEQKNRELNEQVHTDSLTGVANRRKFNEFVAEQFDVAKANGNPLSVLFLDTDHFKKFNDTYGHQTGDRVLVELGAVLKENCPEGALAARYGGEEFAAILPGTDRPTAAKLAEQLREAIKARPVESDEGEELHITASIGVATYEKGCFVRAEQLVKAADLGVYAAKNAGRNCVRVFVPKAKKTAA